MVSKDTCEVSGVGSMVCMFNEESVLRNSRFIDSSLEIVGLSRNYMLQNARSWPEAITNFKKEKHQCTQVQYSM